MGPSSYGLVSLVISLNGCDFYCDDVVFLIELTFAGTATLAFRGIFSTLLLIGNCRLF